jgi:hypothetical protein
MALYDESIRARGNEFLEMYAVNNELDASKRYGPVVIYNAIDAAFGGCARPPPGFPTRHVDR